MASPSRVFLTAEWRHLAMFNFEVAPSELLPFIPCGTELDFHQGRALLSVVGFQFSKMHALGMKIPFHQHFEQINLRFYVKRRVADGWRRGVVFLQEIARQKSVAFAARWFYGEKYLCVPLHSSIQHHETTGALQLHYSWQAEKTWNWIQTSYQGIPSFPQPETEEEFIVKRSFGYTSKPQGKTHEFMIEHRPWKVWPVSTFSIRCDAQSCFGPIFSKVISSPPSSVFVVDGSSVTLYESWPIFS